MRTIDAWDVLDTNGAEFLYINGRCEFWVYRGTATTADGAPAEWQPVFTGVLSEELQEEVERRSGYGTWDFGYCEDPRPALLQGRAAVRARVGRR